MGRYAHAFLSAGVRSRSAKPSIAAAMLPAARHQPHGSLDQPNTTRPASVNTGTSQPIAGSCVCDSSSVAAPRTGTIGHNIAHGPCGVSSSPSRIRQRMPRSPAPVRRLGSAIPMVSAVEVTGERQHRKHAGALHRDRDLLLVTRAGARDAARHDLAAIRDEARQALLVLVVDVRNLLEAQLAELLLHRTGFAIASHVLPPRWS